MLKIENTNIYGWEAAIRGMRNPMNSWNKSDSNWEIDELEVIKYVIGNNDLNLMKNLSKAGNDHSKYLRMINVTLDITAPLYWWKEFDTYKVGTVTDSCSTMHKIQSKEFTIDDFSHEHLNSISIDLLNDIISWLNLCRNYYNEGDGSLLPNNKNIWWQMIQMLPSSYNQKRTVQLNYQVLKSMYFARKDHKLDEWHTLCDWMLSLPYFKEICIEV